MSPSSRREMDFNEQFSPVKSENVVDDEEESKKKKQKPRVIQTLGKRIIIRKYFSNRI